MLATCCYFPRTMQASASNQPDSDYRTCDACGARVHRTEVHKNRYRQYICRDCRASGVHAVGRHRVRRWIQRMPVALVTFGPEGAGVSRFAPAALLDRFEDLPGLAARLLG